MIESIDRVEAGEDQRRVEARSKTGHQIETDCEQDKPGVEQPGKVELLIGQFIEDGQRQQGQPDGEQEGNAAGEERLAEELEDQLGPAAADDFSDADLLAPLERSGDGQVDKVYTGYKEDEPGDPAQNIAIDGIA